MPKLSRLTFLPLLTIFFVLAPSTRAFSAEPSPSEALCAAASDAAQLFGNSNYSCFSRPSDKTFRFEANVIDPSLLPPNFNPGDTLPQASLFWAGAVGFSLAAASHPSLQSWVYEARVSDDPSACAYIDGAAAASLATAFGNNKAKMSTPAFAAKAWISFKSGSCGNARPTARMTSSQAVIPNKSQAEICKNISASQARFVSMHRGACSATQGDAPLLYFSNSPWNAFWDPDTAVETLSSAASALAPNASVYIPEFQSIEPANCFKVRIGDFSSLGELANKRGNFGNKTNLKLSKSEMEALNKFAALVVKGALGTGTAYAPAKSACPGYAAYKPVEVITGTKSTFSIPAAQH